MAEAVEKPSSSGDDKDSVDSPKEGKASQMQLSRTCVVQLWRFKSLNNC